MAQPITLADLNQFTVLSVEHGSDANIVAGQLSKPGEFGPGQHVRLWMTLDDGISGVLTAVDPDAGRGIVTGQFRAAAAPGASFPIFDGYWQRRIKLALDPSITWARMRFVAPDAFVSPAETPGWRKHRIAEPGDENRTDGQMVPGGWDHEHCEICWGKIGMGGDLEGYVEGKNWLCMACYGSYIKPRDLRFVGDGTEPISDAADMVFGKVNRLIDSYDLKGIGQHLDEGGDINARRWDGSTSLMVAASRAQKSLTSLLIARGADINAIAGPEYPTTAVALAAQAGHVEVIQMLLDAGASVDIPNTLYGGSLLQFVQTGAGRENMRIRDLLKQAGAK